jgi:transglutaminase-like putative cysteine protease
VPQDCTSPSIPYGEILSDESGSYLFQSYATRSSGITWYVTCALDHESEILQLGSLYDFPYSGSYPPEVTQYLEFTSLVNHSDEIDLIASQAASGSTSDLEAAMRVAAWVNKEIEYDLAYSGTIECATDVFTERSGTCDEFVTLYMSMLRSLGIPVRYVSGYAYGNIYGSQ